MSRIYQISPSHHWLLSNTTHVLNTTQHVRSCSLMSVHQSLISHSSPLIALPLTSSHYESQISLISSHYYSMPHLHTLTPSSTRKTSLLAWSVNLHHYKHSTPLQLTHNLQQWQLNEIKKPWSFTVSIHGTVSATKTPVEVVAADSIDDVLARAMKQVLLNDRSATVTLHLILLPINTINIAVHNHQFTQVTGHENLKHPTFSAVLKYNSITENKWIKL